MESNRLPTVLRIEIWEYAHGDRTFWMNKFFDVIQTLWTARRYIRLGTWDTNGQRLRVGQRIHIVQTGNWCFSKPEQQFEIQLVDRSGKVHVTCPRLTNRVAFQFKQEAIRVFEKLENERRMLLAQARLDG
jgi:hypothetical protein